MPILENSTHEDFAQNCLNNNRKESYILAYKCNPKNARQSAYNLCKSHPNIVARIEELKVIARSGDEKEVNDYIKFFEDVAFARGEFAGDKKAKIDQRISAAIKAMKAQGIEGSENINIRSTVGYQLVIHDDTKEEEGLDNKDEQC
jgi:3-deoxy-D-arabino-heptulosonate 7-phosphate (DAHP) synthase class II